MRWGNYSICQSQWLMQVPGRAEQLKNILFGAGYTRESFHIYLRPSEIEGWIKTRAQYHFKHIPLLGMKLSELNQLGGILLGLPNTARRAEHCHTQMSRCTHLQEQQMPQLHLRDS